MAKKLAVGYCSEFGALSGAHRTGLVSFSSESPHLHARWNPSPVCQSGAHRTGPVSVKSKAPIYLLSGKKGQCSCSVQHRTHPVTTGLARPLHTGHQCALAETCKVLTLGRRVRCTSPVFTGHIRCMQSCSTESTTLSSRKHANSQMFCQRRKSRVSIFQSVFTKKIRLPSVMSLRPKCKCM